MIRGIPTLHLCSEGFVSGPEPIHVLLRQTQTGLHSVVGVESVEEESNDADTQQDLNARTAGDTARHRPLGPTTVLIVGFPSRLQH